MGGGVVCRGGLGSRAVPRERGWPPEAQAAIGSGRVDARARAWRAGRGAGRGLGGWGGGLAPPPQTRQPLHLTPPPAGARGGASCAPPEGGRGGVHSGPPVKGP